MLSEKDIDEEGINDIPRLSPDFLIETYLDHQVGLIQASLTVGREVLFDL
jgi:hypothetical protein